MKRSLPRKKEIETSRPSTVEAFCMPVRSTQTSFRFQSESWKSNCTPAPRQQGLIRPVRHHSLPVYTKQIRPHTGIMNTRLPWFNNFAFQASRNRFNCLQNPATQRFCSPRYFPVRNPVNLPRFQRINHRFQEPYIAGINPPRQSRSAQFDNGTKFLMNRKWKMIPDESCSTQNDFTFSVASYNVLSDELLFENKYLYQDCGDEVLSWTFRKENLVKELLGYNADILCLQEIDAAHYEDWFEPQLAHAGYHGVYNQRSGDKPDGCATFYRSAKFSLVQKKLVKYYTSGIQILNKDNVGIVVLLKPNIQKSVEKCKQDEILLCVANTHLLFNTKRGDIKLAQLAYLFAEIESLAKVTTNNHNTVYYPVILAGDLNSLPFSPLHNFLTTGQLQYSVKPASIISGQVPSSSNMTGPSARCIQTPLLPWELGITLTCQWRTEPEDGQTIEEKKQHNKTTILTIPFQLQSVYKHIEDGQAEVTTSHLKACCNVDYIFYTLGTTANGTQLGKLILLGKLELPRKSNFIKLPNRQFSSDHIALQACFKITL